MKKYQWTSSNTTKKSQWRSSKKQASIGQIAKATGLLINNTPTNSLNSLNSQKPLCSKKSQWTLFTTIKRNQSVASKQLAEIGAMMKAIESLFSKMSTNNQNNPNPIHAQESQPTSPRKQAHQDNLSPPHTLKSQSATAKYKTAQSKTTTSMVSPKSERKMNPKSKNTKKAS